MNRIAFIASGHAGSTMPLIKAFIDKGYYVDYYILCNKIIQNIEATDCEYTTTKKGVEEIPTNNWPKLSSEFIKSQNLRIYSISTYRPFDSVFLLNNIVRIFRTLQIKKVCKFINEQKYIFVNFIGRYNVGDIIQYAKYIKTKYIVSLHEVCNHENPDFEHPNRVLKYLFSKRIPIVVFSDNSKKDICQYKGHEEAVIYRENFGLFTSFTIYKGRNLLDLPDNYVLFIGRLTPYKGLRLFYEATKSLALSGYKFVVAGNGKDEALTDILNTPNYTVINRYLSDEDFVELVERSCFVVCPYTSISQSGIPQTVFVFNKPMIATNLNGFREVIENKKNGILFKQNDSQSLCESIKLFLNDSLFLKKIINGVKDFEILFPAYSWNVIVKQYESDFINNV